MGEPVSFPMVIRSCRECDEISQSDFAEKLGISRAQLCDIEKGRRTVSLSKVAEFAKILGYPPELWIQLAIQDSLNKNKLQFQVSVEKKSKKKMTRKYASAR